MLDSGRLPAEIMMIMMMNNPDDAEIGMYMDINHHFTSEDVA